MLRDSNAKDYIIQNNDEESPVTRADLEANEVIVRRITEKYKDISWEILS